MFEIVKKSLLAGLGALAMTEDKIQEVIDDLVQKGEISEKEGTSLVHEMRAAAEEQRAKVMHAVDDQVKTVLRDLHLVTKDDIVALEDNLKKELAKIDKRLAKLEKHFKEADND